MTLILALSVAIGAASLLVAHDKGKDAPAEIEKGK